MSLKIFVDGDYDSEISLWEAVAAFIADKPTAKVIPWQGGSTMIIVTWVT